MPRAAISGSAFAPDDIRVMLEVYDQIIAELAFPGDELRMPLASLLMQIYAGGTVDKQHLKAAALAELNGRLP